MTAALLLCVVLGVDPGDVIQGPVPPPPTAALIQDRVAPAPLPVPERPTHRYVLVFWSTAWCGYCRPMKPWINRLYGEGYEVRQANMDTQPELAKSWGISSVPVLVLQEDGKEIDRIVGAVSEATVRKWLNDHGVVKGPARVKPPESKPAVQPVGPPDPGEWRLLPEPQVRFRRFGG